MPRAELTEITASESGVAGPLRVLVLDGHSSAALAFVRSLGRAGHWVAVGHKKGLFSAAACSRYCRAQVEYDSPTASASRFAQSVREFSRRFDAEIIAPMTEATVWPLAKHRTEFEPEIAVVAPGLSAMEKVSDKFWVSQTSPQFGILPPATSLIHDVKELEQVASWQFPIFIKDRFSIRWAEDHGVSGWVEYASTHESLTEKVQSRIDRTGEAFIQAYCPGVGIGISCLMLSGRAYLPFQWRRIREKDPRGSGSSTRVSVAINAQLLEFTEALLSSAGFEGLAMTEFRLDPASQQARILEVNGRPWGSMQLPVHCGLNYPLHAIEWYANQKAPPRSLAYEEGITCRWLAADLTHLKKVIAGKPKDWPLPYPPRLQTIVKMAAPWYPGLRYDDISLSDPWPGLVGLANWVRENFGANS